MSDWFTQRFAEQKSVIKIPETINSSERKYLEAILALTGDSPRLEAIWAMMDLAWAETECDYNDLRAENLTNFYNHPVWLLNGLFVEQHAESIAHRENFTEEIVKYRPGKVCDYGGGYGSLARRIARTATGVSVDLFDPHPHRSSLELSSRVKNIRHVDTLCGPYDVMVATDVFEHVSDPLLEVEKTSAHLKVGGYYLIANCFYPVIKCHLPSTFHFRETFGSILAQMNLKSVSSVAYGTVFEKTGEVMVTPQVRRLERKSQIRFAFQGVLVAVRELRQQWFNREIA